MEEERPRANDKVIIISGDLGRLGEADGISLQVINGEVATKEDVADDPQRSPRKVDVHACEGADACVLYIQNVVGSFDWVRLAIEVEREFRKIGNGIAGQGVLAVPGLRGTDPTEYESVWCEMTNERRLTWR